MAQEAAHDLHGEARDAVIGVLEKLHSENLGLSSALVEALAAYALITPMRNLAHIATEIDEVLVAPPDEEAAQRARSIVVNQLEDERILGPYSEAIASLDPNKRATLLALAAQTTPGDDFFADWVVRQLIDEGDLGDSATQDVLIRFASSPAPATGLAAELDVRLSRCGARLRGVRRNTAIRSPPAGTLRALGLVAELAFWHAREELGARSDDERVAAVWAELAGPLRVSAAQAFSYANMADRFTQDERIHDALIARNRDRWLPQRAVAVQTRALSAYS